MVGAALVIVLLGLGASSGALPGSTQTLENRQTWVGDGGSTFHIGDGDSSFHIGGNGDGSVPTCRSGVPLDQQPPCVLAGDLRPPRKRSEPVGPGSYAQFCPRLEAGERALAHLRQRKRRSQQEFIIMEKLRSFLLACGVATEPEQADGDGDGDGTKLEAERMSSSNNKNNNSPPAKLDSSGLEVSYQKLIRAIGQGKPSFITWLTLEQISSTLKVYTAASTSASSTGAPPPDGAPQPVRRQTFAVGDQTCQLADIIGLKGALASLYAAYGPPEEAPENIFLIDQVIVSTLQLCGQSVSGWTTITPSDAKPASDDDEGSIRHSSVERGTQERSYQERSFSDPRALLHVLRILERGYGTYRSGDIPTPVFLIMVNTVAILQDIPGVRVPGWPPIGRASVGS